MKVISQLNKFKEWRYVALLCVVLVPFLYISQFNHPSADDYCFTVKAQDEGVLNAQIILFTNWSGRFFSTLATTLGPLYYGSFYLVKVFPIAVLFLAFVAFFKLVDELYQHTLELKQLITFGLGFLVLFLLGVNNLPEGLYSYTASLPYLLPVILFVLLMVLLLKQAKKQLTRTEVIFVFVLSACIMGSNETAALLMVIMFTIVFLYFITKSKKIPKNILFLWVFSVFILGIVLSSPGFLSNTSNAVVLNYSFKGLVVKGFIMMKKNMMIWVFKSPLLFFSFVLVIFSKKKTNQTHFLASIHPIIYLLIGIVLFLVLHVFSFYTVDYDHPTRVTVMLFGFFLVWWFFVLQEIIHYYHNNPSQVYLFFQERLFKHISLTQFQNARSHGHCCVCVVIF